MAIIIADASEKILFKKMYRGENVCLQWKSYMFPLIYKYGELTLFMLEWIRTWFNSQLDDTNNYMIVSYIFIMLTQFVEEVGMNDFSTYSPASELEYQQSKVVE